MRKYPVVAPMLLTALAAACLTFADAAAAAQVGTPRASRPSASTHRCARACGQQDRAGRRLHHRRAGRLGTELCAQHVTSFLSCLNLARGGRSTSNYRAEGSWDIALHELRSGGYRQVYVLIQFGHNDQPGKPGRSTDLATEFPPTCAAMWPRRVLPVRFRCWSRR